MPARRIDHERGRRAIDAIRRGETDRDTLATAVRFALQEIALKAPGRSVEIRVPPLGAIQAMGGPGHTRGTPPNVIETDALTLIALVNGDERWIDAVDRGAIRASGTRASLDGVVPLWEGRE